ncbi:MAG: CbrC family protein [Azoarcus sp.]|jgi:uncharacterized protein CbrC (UPF0167 family)|nr:CbrC family protein [Azoarcus sp.]
MPEKSNLPQFKYSPNCYENGIFQMTKADEIKICDCCRQTTDVYYNGPFYSRVRINILCPFCIANGKAAEKYNGEFLAYTSIEGISPNPSEPHTFHNEEAINEVVTRTPCYSAYQQEEWLAHCNDLCAFVGYVGWDEIKNLINEFVDLEVDVNKFYFSIVGKLGYNALSENLANGGGLQGYLFQCLHCNKYRLHIDAD